MRMVDYPSAFGTQRAGVSETDIGLLEQRILTEVTNRDGNPGPGTLECRRVDIGNDQVRATLRECARAFEADAGRGTGHEHLQALEALHADGPK